MHRLRYMPLALAIFAAPLMAQERAAPFLESMPEHLVYAESVNQASNTTPVSRQLYAGKRRWEPGRTLRVCFFGGGASVHRLIAETAVQWLPGTSIGFDFGDPSTGYRDCQAPGAGFSEVRIGFHGGGLWSAVGRQSITELSPHQPSMNLERFDIQYRDGVFGPADVTARATAADKSIILHEFGHAIGLLHEQQSPAMGCAALIRWSGPGNVYEVLAAEPNYWSPVEVDRNLKPVATTDPDYVAGSPDPQSIMMYSLDRRIFVAGADSRCIVPPNDVLSAKDRKIVALIYPRRAPPNLAVADADVGISTASFQPLAAAAPRGVTQDYEARLLTDLESQDTLIRRDARARLAQYLEVADKNVSERLVAGMAKHTYRYQLGVAVALDHVSRDKLTPASLQAVRALEKATNDKALKTALQGVR